MLHNKAEKTRALDQWCQTRYGPRTGLPLKIFPRAAVQREGLQGWLQWLNIPVLNLFQIDPYSKLNKRARKDSVDMEVSFTFFKDSN